MQPSVITYKTKTATEEKIFRHLHECKDNFMQPLDQRVNIGEYAKKIFERAVTFEAWSGEVLIGLVAAYFNDLKSLTGFITNSSVVKQYMGTGVGKQLVAMCIEHAKKNRFREIRVVVKKNNKAAIGLYKKYGFLDSDKKDEEMVWAISTTEGVLK